MTGAMRGGPRGLAARLVAMMALVLSLVLCGFPAFAAPEKAAETSAVSPNAKLKALTDLLADPDVQALLKQHDGRSTEAAAPNAPPATMTTSLADRLQGLRGHLVALAEQTKTLPDDAEMARAMVAGALDERGWWTAAVYFVGFVALGFGVEGLFRLAMRPAQRWLLALTLVTVSERVRAVFARLFYGTGLVLSFGLGSIGAFLLFDWPPILKEIVLRYLIVFLLVRLCAVIGRITLAPGAARFRVVPITTPAAHFLYKRWLIVALLVGLAWQTIGLFSRFGLAALAGELLNDGIAFVMMLIGFDVIWRMPPASLRDPLADGGLSFTTRHRQNLAIGLSLLLVILWMLWVAQAFQLFWLAAFVIGLPIAMMVSRRAVNHILRPPGVETSSRDIQTLDVIIFERGMRSVVIVAAALLFGRILDVDFTSLTMQDTLTTRITRGAIGIVVVGLIADFAWHVVKALIDRKITVSLLHGQTGEDAGHSARLQTLLPIISNILFVVIVVVAVMMGLASAGIEIGPLIASAGVVGVAIGFGAQTLVRDIISGIFYLFDDAFRIGEYIQSGSYKGTVESFSLRSVKLRHQRGALYTVPFGILGAVQNQSRDWVVDKIVLNVPYGTDLDRVRKIIKKIGEKLAEDPEYGPDIINPLKLQGVVQFGDFAIQIQTKMMTKPGDVQFLARRRALLLINQAFIDAGIGFAMPMVHVAGNGDAAAAAAQKSYELLQAAKPT